MRKNASYRKIGGLGLIFLLVLSFATSGCAGDGESVVRSAAANFSFGYPPTYLKPYVQNLTEHSTSASVNFAHSEEGRSADAFIFIDVTKANDYYRDYRSLMEDNLIWAQEGQEEDRFKIEERSPVTVDGAQGEVVVFRYITFELADVGTELGGRPAISYEAYFQGNGLLWSIIVQSIASRADEARADFEHVMRSFRFLD